MKKVVFPIFWHNSETGALAELDIDVPVKDCATRNVTFYRIDAVVDYTYDDKQKGTAIMCGSERYLTPMKRLDVEAKIDEAFKNTY